MLPRTFSKIRCSEVASEAEATSATTALLLRQKQSCSSYMVCRVVHPIIGCPCMHLLSQLTLIFNERRYYSWENSRWWGDRC